MRCYSDGLMDKEHMLISWTAMYFQRKNIYQLTEYPDIKPDLSHVLLVLWQRHMRAQIIGIRSTWIIPTEVNNHQGRLYWFILIKVQDSHCLRSAPQNSNNIPNDRIKLLTEDCTSCLPVDHKSKAIQIAVQWNCL
jgi:hypothetical protein